MQGWQCCWERPQASCIEQAASGFSNEKVSGILWKCRIGAKIVGCFFSFCMVEDLRSTRRMQVGSHFIGGRCCSELSAQGEVNNNKPWHVESCSVTATAASSERANHRLPGPRHHRVGGNRVVSPRAGAARWQPSSVLISAPGHPEMALGQEKCGLLFMRICVLGCKNTCVSLFCFKTFFIVLVI